jgi:hypothetical protein
MLPQPMILESQNAMNADDGATTEPRIRINRPDDVNARCKGSRAPGQRKDFSQCMRQSTTHSTSNATSSQAKRTEPSGPRRCRHGTKPSPRRDFSDAKFLHQISYNVTKPCTPLLAPGWP